jgi:hypothetical protein
MSEAVVRVRPARVVHIIDDHYRPFRVTIDRGAANGVALGDKFVVFGLGPEISDPDTGENLGRVEIVRGQGVVTNLQERLATVTSIERRRIVYRSGPPTRLGVFSAAFAGAPSEERVEEEKLPFLDVQVGDMAKPI